MEKNFIKFLHSLKDAICSSKEKVTEHEVLQLACEQQVEGFFVDSFDDVNKAILARNYTQQLFRYLKVHNILNILNEKGISTLIIKGISVARFYPDYTARRCSDTDILVKRSDYKKIVKILKNEGFTIYKMRQEEHHLCVSHPQTGTIEFHHRLCDEIFDDLWFGGTFEQTEPEISFSIDGMNFKTLGLTDGFIFLFLHFVKHYVLEFVTLKWILDILFYASHNNDTIDWSKVKNVVEKMGYTTLLNTIFGVGIEYLGFNANCFNNCNYSLDKVNALLNDIEFCSKKENRQKLEGFFHVLNIEAKKVEDYSGYITNYNKLGIISNIFASRSRLQYDYPILSKYPVLLPFVWIYRLVKGLCNMIMGKRKVDDFKFVAQQGNIYTDKRISIMKDLDII